MTDKDVIAILHGSPSGTTEARFELFGVKRQQLDKLVKAGKARMGIRTLQHRALKSGLLNVSWFFPT